MFKKLFFVLIGFLFFASSAFAEDLSASLKTASAVYKDGYYEDVPFLDRKALFLDGYYTARISAKDNYLFALGTTPPVDEMFSSEFPYLPTADGYAILNVFDLRSSEKVFSSGYLFKEFDVSPPGLILLRNKFLTISDKYAFVGFLRSFAPLTTKIYDISNLPEVVDKGFIDIFPNAVSKDKALVIDEKGIAIYDITDVTNPVLKGEYLRTNILQHIEIEGNRVYIAYYDADKKKTFLEILDIKNFSFKKIGKEYPFPFLEYPFIFNYNFHVKNKFVYIFDSVEGNSFVFDTSNPYNIHEISTIKGITSFNNIIIDNYAFIVNHPTVILDISNPYNISIALRILDLDLNMGLNFVSDIAASGNYVILKETPFIGPYEGPAGNDLVVFELPSFKVKLNKFNSNVEIKKSPKVILTWQTDSEDRAEKFCIMRKNMNINKKIGCVNAKGTVSQGASYKLIDSTVKNEKTYKYRLLYKDIGGKDHLLKVISVSVPDN